MGAAEGVELPGIKKNKKNPEVYFPVRALTSAFSISALFADMVALTAFKMLKALQSRTCT